MGITGRYNFTGIQKAVSVGINALLASTTWGAWILASPFRLILDQLEGLAVNWLANRGLIVLNIGAIMVDGSIDQTKLDSALNDALTKIQNGRDKITPAAGAAIDKEVADAFDQDADLGATDGDANSVSNVSGSPL
jgi:hypothetical protein